jgi:hypothetical protein
MKRLLFIYWWSIIIVEWCLPFHTQTTRHYIAYLYYGIERITRPFYSTSASFVPTQWAGHIFAAAAQFFPVTAAAEPPNAHFFPPHFSTLSWLCDLFDSFLSLWQQVLSRWKRQLILHTSMIIVSYYPIELRFNNYHFRIEISCIHLKSSCETSKFE